MSNYEDKKQARIDRYRELADKKQAESNSLSKQSSKMIDAIPMGQPMMPDHYSYNRDKNYRDRAWNKMGKSVEAQKTADYYRSKAEAAENNTAISSDDPEAVSKLKDKLQKCEDWQDSMKKLNAYFRKNGTCVGFEGLSDETAKKYDEKVEQAYSWEKQPFASYSLTNNGAEIRRLKKRIELLEKNQDVGFSGWDFEGGKAVANTEENRLQLLFDDIPTPEQRQELKQSGFRWSNYNKAWQRQLNTNAFYAAKHIAFIQPTNGEDIIKLQRQHRTAKKETHER